MEIVGCKTTRVAVNVVPSLEAFASDFPGLSVLEVSHKNRLACTEDSLIADKVGFERSMETQEAELIDHRGNWKILGFPECL